ncbi:nuclear transport factor 2 family protein [Streptomyces sp. WMMC500]|uniref:nuclear transport factor 2 family protein n=1 Tax=Streptomyces sp. WMMC500 TaxID=3015154 RepID=UPI00248C1421|nr:nuclear transport factor 2 family protein [Streptomyces sp. WMMC500]WBB59522.1 nuclear transport factor 2 family protein [Streptomyces sp. WMMC500]
MTARETTDARRFVAEFFTSFTREVTADDGDPGPVVDRYYTPDIVQTADGIRIDRARLVAHIRPVRKNLSDFAFEVHEALRDGDRIAARFTIHATDRRGRCTGTEVHLFGELAPDGRIRRTHQLSRTVRTPGTDGDGTPAEEAGEEGDGS